MSDSHNSFEQATNKASSGGLMSEFIGYMKDNAKWWLIPFLVVFALLGILLLGASTGAAPFIYTMF